MNPADKNWLDSQLSALRFSYLSRFTIDLAVAAAVATLLIKESFGEYNKIACLIAIVYAQLAAFARTGLTQTESNSAKIDIVKGGNEAASREFWDAHWIACNEIQMKYFYLYACLHISLLCVAFGKLFL